MTDVQLRHPPRDSEGGLRSTIEALSAEVGPLRRKVQELEHELARARAHIAHLERRRWWRR